MITDTQKTLIANYFKSKPEIAAAYLFGSQARGDDTKQSDIDMAVIFNDKNLTSNKLFSLGGYEEDLSTLLKTKVDVQDLDQANAIFKYRVLSEGKILHDTRNEEKFDYQIRAVDDYFELKPVYDEYFEEMSKRIQNNSFGRAYANQ